ncbi:MAG: hypothetical protein QF918_16475 [Pirellulaceae bacterium]|nr:hypothetical protein [Pirellulaceae bacterium]MDP6555371.1 hypothetical protein [Pirellulaceae bacterium]MDP6717689.1 hypothetical protein [Pirellulaceae bacterium]
MRLTLRTMLAYLDDILEPKDAGELGEKIQESSFASDLVHRIRTSTRRLRLGAPKLTGQGTGLDPNTVAEYLDNTLPADHVPDFEKVCLESDVHLAEVASCHQVLTIVLGEPAEIDQPLRERMYRIGHDSVESATPGATSSVTPPPVPAQDESGNGAVTTLAPPARTTNSDPAGRGGPPATGVSMKSLAITLLCTFVVVVVALRAVGPFDHTHVAYRLLFGQRSSGEVTQSDVKGPPAPAADGTQPVAGAESTEQAVGESPATVGPAVTQNLDDNAKEPTTTPEIPHSDPPVSPITKAAVDDPPSTTDKIPATVTPGVDPTTVPDVISETPSVPVEPGTTPPTDPPTTVDVVPAPKVDVTEVVEVGRYVAEDQMLARYDASTDDWYQVANATLLAAGDRLISFPTYRPHAVIGDINVTFINATSVELMTPGEEGQPRMNVLFGNAVILPFKAAAGRIALKIGDQEGNVVFGDLDSVAAVKISRYLPPGVDPEKTVANHIFQLYAVSGRVGWSEPGAKTIVVDAGRMLARVDGSAASVVDAGPLPAWIEGRDQKEIERRASLELRTALEKDQPLSRSLMEMTDFRQHEVVDLACRSLSYLAVYDPLVKALSDKRQHYYWSDQFDELRAIGARGPESAAALRRMIEKLHASDAASLYRLTWGFSPAQLSRGGDAELVDLLENDAMSLRVMAFMNLERITGGVTKNFRPELPPSQEKTKVANWRRALNDGAIVYKTPPTPWAPPTSEAAAGSSR